MSGPIVTPGSKPLPTIRASTASRMAAGEAIVDGILNEDRLAQEQVLPGIAKLRSHHSSHCLAEVGVVEDDKRRIAAEFHGYLLHGFGALPQ